MTFFFNLDNEELNPFINAEFINQNSKDCTCIIDNLNNQIIIEKDVFINKGLSSNIYNAGKTGLLTINDNNHLIVRAFAYAWKYKKMYEEGSLIEDIVKSEKMSKRTIYKYLNLAYLSPNIINPLMYGTKTIDLQKLF